MKRDIQCTILHIFIYCTLYLKVFPASNMAFGASKKKTLQYKYMETLAYTHVHLYDLYVHTSISGLLYLHSETNYEPCFSSRPLSSRVVSWPYCHAWNRPFGGTLGTLDTMV